MAVDRRELRAVAVLCPFGTARISWGRVQPRPRQVGCGVCSNVGTHWHWLKLVETGYSRAKSGFPVGCRSNGYLDLNCSSLVEGDEARPHLRSLSLAGVFRGPADIAAALV